MFDLSELNYNELIELEKKIQEEKKKKVENKPTKDKLFQSDKCKKIQTVIEERFQDEKYGGGQKYSYSDYSPQSIEYFRTFMSDEELEAFLNRTKPSPIAEELNNKIHSSMVYLCDVALKNYREGHRNRQSKKYEKPEDKYFIVKINAEFPWKNTKKYTAMYNDLCDVLIKNMEK